MECHQTDAPEQATRRSARRRPPYPQRHLLGLAIRCAVARFAGVLRSSYHLLQSFRSLAPGWRLGSIIDALASAHDAAVQMIIPRLCACTSTVPVSRAIASNIWVVHEAD